MNDTGVDAKTKTFDRVLMRAEVMGRWYRFNSTEMPVSRADRYVAEYAANLLREGYTDVSVSPEQA